MRLLSICTVMMLSGSAAAATLATGDLAVGDATSVVAVDPASGVQTICGVATANVRDVAVDSQRRVIALTIAGSIERFEPAAYDEEDPAANRESVGALAGARGIALDSDATLLVADPDGDRIVRVDPDAFVPGDPTANQSLVSSGGLLDGPLDVAIDVTQDVAYATTANAVVSIDLGADPGSNQQLLANNPFVWASLAVQADGRVVAAGPFGIARLDPSGTPPVTPSVVASGGELQQPTGLAVEAGGTLVVPEFSDGDVVRIVPEAFDPNDLDANQDVVTHFDGSPELRGIAVVPEPRTVALQALAFATLLGFARARSQTRTALV